MNPQPSNKVSLYKLSFVSTGFILLLNAIIDLLATNFKAEYLSIIFDWEYVPFNIGIEGLVIFLCVVGTSLLTSKLPDFSFKTVLIRISLFASFYLLLCLIYQFIFSLVFIANELDPKIITSKILNFKYFIAGMKYSFIFMVVWMVLKYRTKVVKEDSSHI